MSGTIHAWIAVVLVVAATIVTRSFFLLPTKEPKLPGWLRRGMRHAPLAALLAVVVPEIFLTQGQLIQDWKDARLVASVAAVGWYLWSRDLTMTILVGTVFLLGFRLGVGW